MIFLILGLGTESSKLKINENVTKNKSFDFTKRILNFGSFTSFVSCIIEQEPIQIENSGDTIEDFNLLSILVTCHQVIIPRTTIHVTYYFATSL